MVVNLDFTLPILNRWLCWHKKDVSHLVITFGNPSEAHLVSKIWLSTLSNGDFGHIRLCTIGDIFFKYIFIRITMYKFACHFPFSK